MKLKTLFLIIGMMQLSATAYSKIPKVEFPQKSISLKEIVMAVDRKVVVDKKSNSEETNLTATADQPRTIVKGVVKDKQGNTLPGVTVTVLGTTRVAITDINGSFSIQVNLNDKTLVFSFIGMKKQEVPIGGQTTFNIIMENETSTLDEVVIVGYGSQKKVNLTGAVSAVKIDDKLASRSLTNVSSGMSGLIPGLAVAQSSGMAGNDQSSLIIRGLGTINSASPLVVVDGMPDVDINRINMNDVESISVLKDAASSAVYGSRAANGVILITTKSGKGLGKTTLNFSSSYAAQLPTKAYDFMNNYPRALTLEQRANVVNTLPSLLIYKNGTIDQWLALGMINPLAYPNTDWWKIIMRNGAIQNYNLSATGSGDKSNFFISVGVMNQTGLQVNNDYSRYNARFNYDYKVRNNINVGVKFSGNWTKYIYYLQQGFTDTDINSGNHDLEYAIAGITPYDPISGYFGGVMAYGEDAQAYNPYTNLINNLTNRSRQEANTSIYGDWSPIKGLTARFDYALNYYNQFQWNAPTPNTAFNFQTNTFGSRVYVGANAGINNATNTGYKTQMSGSLNYHTLISKYHDLNLMFVYSEEYWYDRFESAGRNDRLYPTLHEIDAALTTTQSTGGNSSTEGLRSYIAKINYSAYDKYLFEANCRYDGSSKFLPGSQFGLFPSAALGWRFTQENFLKRYTQSWLSSGKLRVSYGSLGNNSGVGRYEQQQTLGASAYVINATIVNGFVNSKMTNRNLTWESTTVFNIGMDLGFLKNRLVTEIDYYDRLTTGMNQESSMSNLLTGAYDPPPRINIGNLRNRGVEINITWKDRVGEFNYAVNMNASYNRTNLEKWSGYLGRGNRFINMPYHFVYGYKDIGIAKTWQDVYNATPQGASPGDLLLVDVNGDGKIDGNDQVAYPNAQADRPTTNFGMNANISWKGFDLSLLLQGAAGRKSYWLNNYKTTNIPLTRYASSWTQWNNPWAVSNPNGSWPRLAGNGNNQTNTSFWLDDMSYLRVKNVQIGYNLPKKWLQRLGVENVRIYATAENFATLTKYRGLDPESQGDPNYAYPVNKSFSLGINVGL